MHVASSLVDLSHKWRGVDWKLMPCVYSYCRSVVSVRPFVLSLTLSRQLIRLSLEPNQTNFCISGFDELCSRCSTSDDGGANRKEVRFDELPVCAQPPPGATALSIDTTVEALTLEEGYVRASNQSHVVLKGYQESACHGGNDTDKCCTSGYTGPCEKSLGIGFCIVMLSGCP